MKELGVREDDWLFWIHTAWRNESQDLDSGHRTPEYEAFTTMLCHIIQCLGSLFCVTKGCMSLPLHRRKWSQQGWSTATFSLPWFIDSCLCLRLPTSFLQSQSFLSLLKAGPSLCPGPHLFPLFLDFLYQLFLLGTSISLLPSLPLLIHKLA